jgi:exonuclease III
LEICAIQLVTKISHLIILSLYRAPSWEDNAFLRRLDATLKYLYNPKSEFIICGDININYLNESSHKNKQTLYWRQTICQTVNFATRVQNS